MSALHPGRRGDPDRFSHGSALRSWLIRAAACFAVIAAEAQWAEREAIGGRHRAGSAVKALAASVLKIQKLAIPLALFAFGLFALRTRASGSFCFPSPQPIRWTLLSFHAVLFAAFAAAALAVQQTRFVDGASLLPWTVLCIILAAASTVAIVAALLPWSLISLVSAGEWLVGLTAAIASVSLVGFAQSGWKGSEAVSAACVRWVIAHLGYLPGTAPGRIGTELFTVRIDPGCSGYEGMGLFLVFSALWLAWFRREYRFPAALALIPLGIATSWILNIARLVSLILIGHYGHREIAMGGFHSQAGWIAFGLLSVGFCAFSARIPGVAAASSARSGVHVVSYPAAPYLGPFVGIQVAAILTAALSYRFEWLYPVRILTALTILWYYRAEYSRVRLGDNLRAAWMGVAGFVVWMLFVMRLPHDAGPVAMLNQTPVVWRAVWFVSRVAGGIVIAPFVEELAFRGFLMRRIQGADFDLVDPRQVGWMAIAVSSLCFGLLHGTRWMEGTIAGVLFALAYRRKGQLGDAILAHSLTNLLLAAMVGITGDWRFW